MFFPVSIAHANVSSWSVHFTYSSFFIINKCPEKAEDFSFMIIEWLLTPQTSSCFPSKQKKWRQGRNTIRIILLTTLCPALHHLALWFVILLKGKLWLELLIFTSSKVESYKKRGAGNRSWARWPTVVATGARAGNRAMEIFPQEAEGQ